MGKLINVTSMTIDGLVDVGSWFIPEGARDVAVREQWENSGGMVTGRKSYEGFVSYWPAQTGPWAYMLNPLPKFVASRTLEGPLEWNASLIEGDAAQGVARLKAESENDLLLSGCGELARNLLDAEQLDELHFWVHPRSLSGGRGEHATPRVGVIRHWGHVPSLRAARGRSTLVQNVRHRTKYTANQIDQ
jgi:dihydrofolate reductase